MINDVLDKVSVALYDEFGGEYTIYPEQINQNFKTPCFMLQPLETHRKQFVGNRYLYTIPINIWLIPVVNGHSKNANAIADRLYNCLELIGSEGDYLRGTNMSTDYDIDGNLQFSVTYTMTVSKDLVKDDAMDELSVSQSTR